MRQAKGTQPPQGEQALQGQEESNLQVGHNDQSSDAEDDACNEQVDIEKDLMNTPVEGNNFLNDNLDEEEESTIHEADLLKIIAEILETRDIIERRPLPVFLRAKQVDLVKLCVQVRACGGYDKVMAWSSISKNLGFGPECGPLLKLVYVKYLKAVENRRLVGGRRVQIPNGTAKIQNEQNEEDKDTLDAMKAAVKSSLISASKKRKLPEIEETPVVESNLTEQTQSCSEDSDSLASMLKWVKSLALDPGGSKKSHGSRMAKGKEVWIEKCESLAGKVRAALWKRVEDVFASDPPPETPAVQVPNSRTRARLKVAEEKTSTKKSRNGNN